MKSKTIWPGSTQLGPVPAVLIGCGNGSPDCKYNLFTVAWTGIVCSDPPQIGISVRPERFSYGLIEQTGEFTVNLPSARLAPAVDYCGVASGRSVDKFAVRHLTACPCSKISAPMVGECPVTLECRVNKKIPLGSHDFFIADILAVQVDSDLIDDAGKFNAARADLLGYVHGHYYALGRDLGFFGFSVRRKASVRSRK